jgi:hypothetical protein
MASKTEKEIQRQMSHKMSEKVCNEASRSLLNGVINRDMKKPRK